MAMMALLKFLLVMVFCADLVTPFSLAGLKELFAEGGKQKQSSQSSKGQKGDQGYSSVLDREKSVKGYHDNADRSESYGVEDGNKRAYFDDDGYFRAQAKGSQGKSGFRFGDHGSYAKGHNIKGHHNIHKLDELNKKTEFFDEDHDQAFKEKHGGYQKQIGYEKGSNRKGQNFNKGFLEAAFGLGGSFEKGSHDFQNKGHALTKGENGYYSKGDKYNTKGGTGSFKEWGFGLH